MSWTRCLIFPGRRNNAYSEIDMICAGAEGARTHHDDISFQGSRSGERDGGLIHGEEAMLDVSAPSGTAHFSSHSTASAIFVIAVAFKLSRSGLERAASIRTLNDGAEMNSVTRYVLPRLSSKTSYTRATRGALCDC